MSIEKSLKKLKLSSSFRSDKDYENFSKCILELKDIHTVQVLHVFFESLNNKDAGEIQYEIVEACEAFPDEMYINEFLYYSESLKRQAQDWYELMFQSLLNTQECESLLINSYKNITNQSLKKFILSEIEEFAINDAKYKKILKKING